MLDFIQIEYLHAINKIKTHVNSYNINLIVYTLLNLIMYALYVKYII